VLAAKVTNTLGGPWKLAVTVPPPFTVIVVDKEPELPIGIDPIRGELQEVVQPVN
jgi:hypothetical protein